MSVFLPLSRLLFFRAFLADTMQRAAGTVKGKLATRLYLDLVEDGAAFDAGTCRLAPGEGKFRRVRVIQERG